MRRITIKLLCAMAALFALTGCAVFDNLLGQPQLQTYTFNYDGRDYSALLPKDVPVPPEDAEFSVEHFPWWGSLYGRHVRYVVGHEYPVVSFWFDLEKGVLALIYHYEKGDQKKHTPYIYVKGFPLRVPGEEIDKRLKEWAAGK